MTISIKVMDLLIGSNHPVAIMGIMNLSKESFFKQSYVSIDNFKVNIEKMIDEKVDIVDIGARSTAPGVKPISVEEEKNRLLPILIKLKDYPDVPISIDTQFSEIAELGLKHNASIINDISGFKTDENIITILKDHDCPSVVMATKKIPGDALTIKEIMQALDESIKLSEKYDYDTKKIIIDPGVGRWVPNKVASYNVEMLNSLEKLKKYDQPILVGISRKSFIGDILSYKDPLDRLQGTLAATAISVYNGADIIRTHDIKITRDHVNLMRFFRNYKLGNE
ncbi:MAG: dihydropteroate synthase [Candidatus Helarchaeota archaeon]